MSLLPVSPVAPLAVAGTALGSAGGAVVGTFGRMLRAALNAGGGAATSSAISRGAAPSEAAGSDPAAAAGRAAALKAEFAARFRALLAEQGIEPGRPVELALDEFGDLRVVGFHPQSSAIEHALVSAPELVELFGQLAAVSRQIPAGRAAFHAAGDLPVAFGPGGPPRFVLTIAPESAEGRFDV